MSDIKGGPNVCMNVIFHRHMFQVPQLKLVKLYGGKKQIGV